MPTPVPSILPNTPAQKLALLLNNSGGEATEGVHRFIRESGYRKDIFKPGVCVVAWALLVYLATWEVAPLMNGQARLLLLLILSCVGLVSIIYALGEFEEKLRTYLFLLKPFTKAPGACRKFNAMAGRWSGVVLAVERPLYGVDLFAAEERLNAFEKIFAADKEKQECAQAHAHVPVRATAT